MWITSFCFDFTNTKITAQVPSERGQSRESELSYLLTRSVDGLMLSSKGHLGKMSAADNKMYKCAMLNVMEEQTGQTAQTFQQRKSLGGGLPCRKKPHTLCVTVHE